MKKVFNKIIAPVDGSSSSKKAVKKAISIAKATNLYVLALYVIQTPLTVYPSVSSMAPVIKKDMKEHGKSFLNEIKKLGKKEGVKIITKIVEGFPDQEIIKLAKKNDLIIMGSKGTSALDRIFLGSVSEKVIHHSPSTVMIVR